MSGRNTEACPWFPNVTPTSVLRKQTFIYFFSPATWLISYGLGFSAFLDLLLASLSLQLPFGRQFLMMEMLLEENA